MCMQMGNHCISKPDVSQIVVNGDAEESSDDEESILSEMNIYELDDLPKLEIPDELDYLAHMDYHPHLVGPVHYHHVVCHPHLMGLIHYHLLFNWDQIPPLGVRNYGSDDEKSQGDDDGSQSDDSESPVLSGFWLLM